MPVAAGISRVPIVAFVLSIALSAMLLFSLEPMVSRMLLPYFGGSASVWSVALVFFQAALLAGYLYALVVARYLQGRASVALHVVMLIAGLAFLPVAMTDARATDWPALDVLIALAGSIGLPFVVLSANAPLLQAWFTRSDLPGADNPYPLYAASNAGSLVALAAYPFLIEPSLGLRQQSIFWLVAYIALVCLVATLSMVRQTWKPQVAPTILLPGWPILVRWIALAAVPSAGLVAVTAHISTNIAAAPFLWVAPLGLYLATFVIAFAGFGQRWRRVLRLITSLFIALSVLAIHWHPPAFLVDSGLQLATYFLIALAFHLSLVDLKPDPMRLTGFYVAMSAGGLVGGVFAALVAPALFSGVGEYPVVLAAAVFGIWRPIFAALPALIILSGAFLPAERTLANLRSFYGVHKIEVTPDGAHRLLLHGREIHGAQRVILPNGGPARLDTVPLTYYDEDGPLSEAIDQMRAKRGGQPISIGVVGLGAGSMACLVEPADRLTFFEIDPKVVTIARNWFTFLPSCHAHAQIVMGDARLSLKSAPERFDLLVVDAFSGDAIPTHLMTREALGLYMDRLSEGGVLLLHISNNHLRLDDVTVATARSLGLALRLFDEDEPRAPQPFVYAPTVVAVARDDGSLAAMFPDDEWLRPPVSNVRPWSDDYANPLGALLAKLRQK